MPAQKRPPPPSSAAAAAGESSSPPPPLHADSEEAGAGGGVGKQPPKQAKQEADVANNKDSVAGGGGGGGGSEESSESELESGVGEKEEFIPVKLADIRKEVQCPICLGIIRKTRTVMECLHRFCRECIDKSMRLGNNECPACRTHCASRRSLRDDPNYDALIAALYPDIDKYEEEELAFNEEENDRNKQIQASIAEAFRKQSEVIGRRSNARATAAAIVRRSRRNMRANGQNNYLRGRGRGRDSSLACSDDEDGNVDNGAKESSSADECSPDKKQKRYHKWPTPRSSPARVVCDDDVGCDEKDDLGVGRENLSTSPLRAWGKNGARSQTRHGNSGNSNGRMVKGGRMIKLVECLRNSADNDNEFHVHLCLLPLDGQTMRNLEKSYLCCGPTLSIKHLCQFIALRTSCQAEEVEIYSRKPPYGDSANGDRPVVVDKAQLNPLESLQILAGEKCLAELHSSCTFPQGDLELVYAIKLQT